jgi:protein SCO1/2
MILTPGGKLSRYFYDIQYPGRDLRLGLVEASQSKIGSPVDQILLYCLHYDASVGKYSANIMNVVRLLGVVTMLCVGAFILALRRIGARRFGQRNAASTAVSGSLESLGRQARSTS